MRVFSSAFGLLAYTKPYYGNAELIRIPDHHLEKPLNLSFVRIGSSARFTLVWPDGVEDKRLLKDMVYDYLSLVTRSGKKENVNGIYDVINYITGPMLHPGIVCWGAKGESFAVGIRIGKVMADITIDDVTSYHWN